MPDDPRALIEQTRAEHTRCECEGDHTGVSQPICTRDGWRWPCLPARLADALEAVIALGDLANAGLGALKGERDAAERRAAEMEEERRIADAGAAVLRAVGDRLAVADCAFLAHRGRKGKRDLDDAWRELRFVLSCQGAGAALLTEHAALTERAEKAEGDLQRFADLFEERGNRIAALTARAADLEQAKADALADLAAEGRELAVVRERLSESDRRAAELQEAEDLLLSERDAYGSALETIETEVSEAFDNDCPDNDAVQMVRYTLAQIKNLTARAERAEAELAYTKGWAHTAGGNLSHMDGVAADLRGQLGTLTRDLEAANQRAERAEHERDQLKAAIDAAWDTTKATIQETTDEESE